MRTDREGRETNHGRGQALAALLLLGLPCGTPRLAAQQAGGAGLPAGQNYPVPSYLPPDYVLSSLVTDGGDGFGGSSEISLVYRNRKSPRGVQNPLMLVMSSNPAHDFSTVQGHGWKPVEVLLSSGETAPGKYYDGMWNVVEGQKAWNTDNAHSIVLKLRDLTIGIRASRVAGVSYEELLQVAGSLR